MKIIGSTALVLSTIAIAACGGSSDQSTDQPSSPSSPSSMNSGQAGGSGTSIDGETIFSANCASCHTLAAAGAAGVVGPNLDELKPDMEEVMSQVQNGGGGMPSFAGTLSPAEITAVSKYVSTNAGK